MEKKLLIDFCKAVRNSTLKRLKAVPAGFENWRISKNALSFTEIAKHLIQLDNWTIKKINDPSIQSILPEKTSVDNYSRDEFNSLISELEVSLENKIIFFDSINVEKMHTKMYDDRFKDKVTVEWIILRGNLDHEIHHRGQIATYLRALKDGGKV